MNEVAWYAYSARPGEKDGTTVLAAHVDTVADGLGPFANLRDLRRGDDLTVTDAAGRLRSHTVTAVETVDKSEVRLERVFRRDGDPELKVITCGGSLDRRAGYSDNVIVTAPHPERRRRRSGPPGALVGTSQSPRASLVVSLHGFGCKVTE